MAKRTAKEVWPGAGLALEWEGMENYDFRQVEEWLTGFSDANERLANLLRLKTCFEYESEKFLLSVRELDQEPDHPSNRNERLFRARAEGFRAMLDHEIAYLQKNQPAEEASKVEESEADTSQRAMVLYYLAAAASKEASTNKSALGRLLQIMTGQKPSSTKDHWQNPTGKKDAKGNWTAKSKADREAVRALLADLGATK